MANALMTLAIDASWSSTSASFRARHDQKRTGARQTSHLTRTLGPRTASGGRSLRKPHERREFELALHEAGFVAAHRRVGGEQGFGEVDKSLHAFAVEQRDEVVRAADLVGELHLVGLVEALEERQLTGMIGMFIELDEDERAQPPLEELGRDD